MVKVAAVLVLVVAAVAAALSLGADDEARSGFHVDDASIIGLDGERFVPIGVNLLGPDAFFNADGETAGHARVLRDAWNVNTVRLNTCLPQGCPYTGVHNERNDDLDALVEEYTGAGLVVMIALHQVEPGGWPDDGLLDRMATWWHDVALRYGDEPLVWFNLLNEPGHDRPASERWLHVHRRLLDAVRSAGAENLVVVDGTQWGQEAGEDGSDPVRTEDSAILTYGDELAGDDDAVAFSFHAYDQWASEHEPDETRDARMTDFIRRVRDAGHAVMIGETGTPADDECCDDRSLGTATAYRVAAELGIGLLAWHGQGVDGFQLVDVPNGESSPSAIDDHLAPTNLTWHGSLLWDLAHTSRS